MMDGTWGYGQVGRRGGCRDGEAQCRAPCLRGTCVAWGEPGWCTDPARGGYGLYVTCFMEMGGRMQALVRRSVSRCKLNLPVRKYGKEPLL